MRSVPFDLQAERATLGAIVLDREAIIAVAPRLAPEHFYLEKHAWIYEAALTCFNRRVPPDLATLSDELRRHERLEPIGGLAFLGELAAEVPTAVHVEYYAAIVERTAVRRHLIETGGRIAALGYAEEEELAVTLDKAEQALFAVSQQRRQAAFVPLTVLNTAYFDWLQRLREGDCCARGVATGLPDLDGILALLQPGDMIILAARPSQGKTACALSIALNVGVAGGHVGIFSLEMSKEQIQQRFLAMLTGIDTQRIRTGDLRIRDVDQIIDAMATMSELDATRGIVIEDSPGLSISELRGKARRAHAEHPFDLIIIDYLQLMIDPHTKKQSGRVQEVSAISNGVKGLARELQVPVIALSQLSRAVESRTSHVPMLSDLRESGSLEQDADVVIFIYREEVYDKETDKKGIAELHVAKHRNGPLGIAPCRFDTATTRFVPLDRFRAPEG